MIQENNKPDCYDCKHRGTVPGDTHSRCKNLKASVTANEHGRKRGWFIWPFNFDPIWLESCTGFESKNNNNADSGNV